MRWYLFIISLILVMGLASASETNEYQYFTYNQPSTYLANCFLDNLPCPDTINCTITIYSPKNNTLINNIPISYDGHLFTFPLSASDNSRIGTYQGSIYCNNAGTFFDKFPVSYEVTNTGSAQTVAQSIGGLGYIIIMIFVNLSIFYLSYRLFDTEKLWILGIFFLYISIVLLTYNLWLGVEYYANWTGNVDSNMPQIIFYIFLCLLVLGLLTSIVLLFTYWKQIFRWFKNETRKKDEDEVGDPIDF